MATQGIVKKPCIILDAAAKCLYSTGNTGYITSGHPRDPWGDPAPAAVRLTITARETATLAGRTYIGGMMFTTGTPLNGEGWGQPAKASTTPANQTRGHEAPSVSHRVGPLVRLRENALAGKILLKMSLPVNEVAFTGSYERKGS